MISPTLENRERLSRIAPATYQAAVATEAEVEAAMSAAIEKANAVSESIRTIERQLIALARYRSHTSEFRAQFGSIDLEAMARTAFDAFEMSATSACPANVSAWDVSRARLAEMTALKPFVSERIKLREQREREMVSALKTAAQKSQVDIAELLRTMRTESDPRAGGDVRTWTLFQGGFFNLD